MSIHPAACIDPGSTVDPSVIIGLQVVIEGSVQIGKGTRIISQAYIAGWTSIGQDCTIHSFASIGDAPQDRSYDGQESYCEIGDRTIIREGVTIHRSSSPACVTRIGNDCMLSTGLP